MKKVFLCLFCMMLLVGCGGGGISKPDEMSDKDFEYIERVIEASDEFLDGKLTLRDITSRYDTLSTLISGDDEYSDKIKALIEVTYVYLDDTTSIDVAGELVHQCRYGIEDILE